MEAAAIISESLTSHKYRFVAMVKSAVADEDTAWQVLDATGIDHFDAIKCSVLVSPDSFWASGSFETGKQAMGSPYLDRFKM